MRLLHGASRTRALFDDPNVVSCAGLVPVMGLAQSCGLHGLLAALVHLGTSIGTNPAGKITAIVAGMVTGADSIDDLDVIRHGGMPRCSAGATRRPRWARSCGSSASGTPASSAPPLSKAIKLLPAN